MNHNLQVVAIAVEKGGLNAAVIEIRDALPNIVVNLLEYQQGAYHLKSTSYVSVPEGIVALSADFDRSGNLYLAHTFLTVQANRVVFLSRILQVVGPDLNSLSLQPLDRNLDSTELAEAPKNVPSSESYWVVMVVDGFDADVPVDNDPNDPQHPDNPARNESGTLGQTVGKIPPGQPLASQDIFQPICGVFRETIRDASEEHGWQSAVLERALTHEILCHAMAWDHEFATLCHPTHLEAFTGGEISEDHLAALRRLPRPRL